MDKPIISGNKIIVPSDHEFLNDVDVFVEGLLRGYGTDESVIADIAISVSELVNNAMTHGRKGADNGAIEVVILQKGKDAQISVTDQGTGFNPDEIADPLAEENLLKEVGRGIFIVRSLMDDVQIETSDQGTTITITKSIG